MQTITRRAPGIIGGVALLLIVAGCGQGDAEAGGESVEASGTPATSGAPVAAEIPAGGVDADQAEDRIEAALEADATLGTFQLDADDEGERIVIEGIVETEAQKAQAAEIAARAAPGVSVDNRLRVDATGAGRQAADAAADEAEDRVEDAFDADATLGAFDLDADDENGRLVLRGTVQTEAQRSQAEEVARRVAPGVALDNQIQVG